MHYHLILTEKCNLRCKYCYEKSMLEEDNGLDKKFKFCFSSPIKSNVEVGKLKEFIDKDENSSIVFYGGEPLLEIDKIKEIMDKIDVPYRMQTNGIFLNKLPCEYMNRIDKILISIDGEKSRTDYNRGKGVFGRILKNIEYIRKNGYKGEIVARMTLNNNSYDIYEQVLFLLNNGFDSVHWQIDAEFYKFDYDKEIFGKFLEEYNESITKLIDYWLEKMRSEGKVLFIYPFVGIMQSILNNEKTKLRCGAGYQGYAIDTTGKIIACPITNGIVDFEAGTIDDDPKKLKIFSIGDKCLDCSYLDLCGGRCLYSNKAQMWPKEGQEQVCNTIKHLIDSLKLKQNEIENLIKIGKIKLSDFNYEKYFGPEIIP